MGAEPVFPGAQGFGIQTPAGRGGAIIRVTNLESDGPGSLRAALDTKGPRIIVFEVGGIIDLNRKSLVLKEPFVTVAGQTAPSPGITLIRGGIEIATHDVLMQHIRVRMGDAGQPKKSGWEPEVTTKAAYNVIVDHCSMAWAVDENLSASGPRYNGPNATTHDTTFSNNILAEGLYDSSHSKGIHSMGTLIHDNCRNIAVIGNLYADNNQRNPYFKALTTGVIVNNVVYNPGKFAIEVDWLPSEWQGRSIQPENARVSVVGNVIIYGANTTPGLAAIGPMGDVYLEDNIGIDKDGHHIPEMTAGQVNILKQKPVWPEGFKAMPAKDTVAWIVAHCGARPSDRDEVDKRVIRDFQQRKGHFIDSQEQVGGYPKATPVTRKLDIPKDNIDAWLAKMARDLEN
ncbi:MAG TPA: hypothetical protein VG675_01330 [Bryobacteraceae bacterium]|nr:hypothetical protein [Bryobacteraceae bacterium]